MAEKSTEPVSTYISSFVPLLKLTYDDACSRYVELFLEREGSDSLADRLSEQTLLVFLVDDTDLLPSQQHHDAGKQQTSPRRRLVNRVDCVEREGSDSLADRLSEQTLLVFLVDDTDLLPSQQHRDAGKQQTSPAPPGE